MSHTSPSPQSRRLWRRRAACLAAAAALVCACAPERAAAPEPTTAPPNASTSAAPETASGGGACADIPASGAFSRAIPGADRACATHQDCASVLRSCGACSGDCAGVKRALMASYDAADPSCDGYTGSTCNYDCRVHDVPQCVDGCCQPVPWYTLGLDAPPAWETRFPR